MKVLLPVLRDNHRYLLCRVFPEWAVIEPREMYYTINAAATAWLGDLRTSEIQPVVIHALPGKLVLRCTRGGESEMVSVLAAIHETGGKNIAIRPVRTSGTLLSLERKSPGLGGPWSEVGALVLGTQVRAFCDPNGRLDVRNDDTGPKQLRFITTHEVEGA